MGKNKEIYIEIQNAARIAVMDYLKTKGVEALFIRAKRHGTNFKDAASVKKYYDHEHRIRVINELIKEYENQQ